MEAERAAAGLGIAGCALVVALTGVPYLVIDARAVGVYYRAGAVGPPLIALFAVVAAIVLLAGTKRRTDPATAAGVAVVIGLFVAALAWWWALALSPALVGGFTEIDAFRHHRWALALSSLVVAVAAGWYARSVL